MFSRMLAKYRPSLTLRLTLWYAMLFMVSLGIAFTVTYWMLAFEFMERTDRNLERRNGHFAAVLAIRDLEDVQEAAFIETKAFGEKEVFIRMLAPNGEVFWSSSPSYWKDLAVNAKAIRHLLEGQLAVLETVTHAQTASEVRIFYSFIGPRIIIQMGQSLNANDRFLGALVRIFAVTMLVLFSLAVVIGWLLSKRALSGVAAVTVTARKISSESLQERVVVEKRHGDEIDRLAGAFNTMLDRIEELVTGIREMSENIAHDLRSPITRLRGLAEITLTTGATVGEYENMAADTIEECDRLLDMINTMLIISKTEAGVGNIQFEGLDLAVIAREACALFGPLAEDSGLHLTCETVGACPFRGDLRMMQRMLSNLIDNAIKCTASDGQIAVKVALDAGRSIQVEVTDTGTGISETDLPLIFNRFFRCDESRSLPGTGLGLSLAQTVVRAHGGNIRVSSQKGQGSTFTIVFPI